MGAKYLGRNVDALATDGRLVIIGMQGGTQGRARPQRADAQARRRHRDHAAGPPARRRRRRSAPRSSSTSGRWSPTARSRPVVHTTLPLAEAAGRTQLMESSDHIGKILLDCCRVGGHERRPPEEQVVDRGPDGQPVGGRPRRRCRSVEATSDDDERRLTELVEQPAKVMRIGSMIRQLLEEVKAAPLDEAGPARLAGDPRDLHQGARGRPGARAGRGAGAAVAAVHEDRHADRGRAADRAGPAGRAGWRGCSTASRPRSTPSRSRPAHSSSRCGARCRPAWATRTPMRSPANRRSPGRPTSPAAAGCISSSPGGGAAGAGRTGRRGPARHPGRPAATGWSARRGRCG